MIEMVQDTEMYKDFKRDFTKRVVTNLRGTFVKWRDTNYMYIQFKIQDVALQ